MVNTVTMVGRMVQDPELRYTPSGVAVARFTLAVTRPFKNAQGDVEADFIDCVAWQKSAEFLARYGMKGRLTGIEGRLQVRSWNAADGSKRRSAEVVAERIQFLDSRGAAAADAAAVPAQADTERVEATLFA
ncbi:MAG: single-stranded DNA-binding protein [Armatimonadetes bacterium]|nr:single-stranded DNA-binding protein [Armatimonadota bacterium]